MLLLLDVGLNIILVSVVVGHILRKLSCCKHCHVVNTAMFIQFKLLIQSSLCQGGADNVVLCSLPKLCSTGINVAHRLKDFDEQ